MKVLDDSNKCGLLRLNNKTKVSVFGRECLERFASLKVQVIIDIMGDDKPREDKAIGPELPYKARTSWSAEEKLGKRQTGIFKQESTNSNK